MRIFLFLCVFAPLVSTCLTLFIGLCCNKALSKSSVKLIGTGLSFASAFGAWGLFFMCLEQHIDHLEVLSTWFDIGTLKAQWALRVNMLSVVMMIVVTSVSAFVHLYSTAYMDKDAGLYRFIAYLGLFTFMMLMLVSANDMVQLFFGWEGVGVCSYLLIGFWYTKEAANRAALKAFLVNRVGDLFLILGCAYLYYLTGTLKIQDALYIMTNTLPPHMTEGFFMSWNAYDVLGLLFFVGAMGKSAQLGLHTWLPDAMEGPTPVSALIHAATMVTAGVFLVALMSPLYIKAPFASSVVMWVGALTAVFAGTIAITQTDIKRVIAYSTCSQLGYMFLGAGVGAFNGAIFHLMTHGFFKALLFLGAGAVIHGMSHEQNMFKMGNLVREMKVTFIFMFVGILALLGVPILSGYYSKEAILGAVFKARTIHGLGPYLCGIAALVLTALYSARLLVLVFFAPSRADDQVKARIHEPGWEMSLPLGFLTIGSVVAGFLGEKNFLLSQKEFWGDALVAPLLTHETGFMGVFPTLVAILSFVIFVCVYIFLPNMPNILSQKISKLYRLFLNKWFFDELYHVFFVKGSFLLGRFFWKKIDGSLIDRCGLGGAVAFVSYCANKTKHLQTGFVFHYTAVIIFAFSLLGFFMLKGAAGWNIFLFCRH